MMGIITAQLWRLQHSLSPDPVLGYYVLAKPVSATLHVSALLTAVTGATRFWRQQTAMALGKVHAGGWEMSLLAGFVMLVSLLLKGVRRRWWWWLKSWVLRMLTV
jgi:hypothetical protein